MILVHFNSDGTLDLSYAVEGVATADFGVGTIAPGSIGYALIQQADGKLVAVGQTGVGVAVARFDDGATFPGIIGLIRTGQMIGENTATVDYSVRRTGGSNGSVSVDYATADDTATSGSDYEDAFGTLNWDDGDMSDRIITINLIDDAEVEQEENFSLTLSAPTGGVALAASEASTVIGTTTSIAGRLPMGRWRRRWRRIGAWSLMFLFGFAFAGNVPRRRKYFAET